MIVPDFQGIEIKCSPYEIREGQVLIFLVSKLFKKYKSSKFPASGDFYETRLQKWILMTWIIEGMNLRLFFC